MNPLLALALAAAPALAPPAAPKHPNVLFIIADDLNCDLGCYGNPAIKSPNIDKLAASGVRFDRAYVQYPVCNPSRTSFLTGLRPTTTGVLSNDAQFRKTLPDAVTMPQFFKRNGYDSFGLGKVFHRGLSPDEPRADMDDARSFDEVFYGSATTLGNTGPARNMTGGALAWCRWRAANGGDSEQADGQTAARAVELLKAQRAKPLFLAIGFYRPHDPFQSPKEYFDLYDPSKLELPKSPADYRLPNRFAIPRGEFGKAFDRFTDRDRREFLHAYYAGVSFVDAQVGKLLAALDEAKLADDTIVVFIGDHGYELGTRNWWNKSTLFERSCRTPLIVRAPGAKGNGRPTKAMTEFIDLYPTLAELCHLDNLPKTLEGASFAKILNDPAAEHKAAALTVCSRGQTLGRSLRTPRWRYTEWGDAGAAELYDHDADPGEWVNLADKPELKAIRAELAARLRAIGEK